MHRQLIPDTALNPHMQTTPDIPEQELARAPLHYAEAYRAYRDALHSICLALLNELDPQCRRTDTRRAVLAMGSRPISPEELDRYVPAGGAQ